MSEVAICNVALAYLGESPIRSLDETNRAAGLCSSLYPFVRDELLSGMDWSFARKTVKLQQFVVDDPEGAVFSLPADCLTPLNLLPRYQERTKWTVLGGKLRVEGYDSEEEFPYDLYLKYTCREKNTSLFSSTFKSILALELAVRMCMPLTQDPKLLGVLDGKLRILRLENEAEDANRGDEYRFVDEDPEYDTFVNPIE